jgi:hypothetical protein
LIFRKAQFTPPLGHRDPFNLFYHGFFLVFYT